MIDLQVQHLGRKSLASLEHWLCQQWNHCQEKKAAARHGLALSGVGEETLQMEWQAQVSAQTKPAPSNDLLRAS